MRSRSIPFWISAFIHGAFFGAAAILFIQPAQFAMDSGHNSVEVNLVAAAPDPVTPPPPTPEPPVEALEQPPKPDDVVVPVTPPTPPVVSETPPEKTPPPPVVVKPKPRHTPTVAKGDGSAPKPGKDATTAQSDGGAIMDTKPDYLSNPPPIYPEMARKAGEQGVVLLEVIVNSGGRPDSVSIERSSGFVALDDSAVTAVQQWRFRPAMLGSIQMKSRVRFPVRFRLDKE